MHLGTGGDGKDAVTTVVTPSMATAAVGERCLFRSRSNLRLAAALAVELLPGGEDKSRFATEVWISFEAMPLLL